MTHETRTEILAGVTTFLAMSYIAVVNPAILSSGTGLGFAPVMTATVLVAAIASVLMGTVARLPYALKAVALETLVGLAELGEAEIDDTIQFDAA
jgi:xanthine/uracil/vitamin C permease (AzgA family)